MKRITIEPRPDWKAKVEKVGLIYHTTGGEPYWFESAYYSFTSSEIDLLEEVTENLHEMCVAAAQHIVDDNRFEELGIPPAAVPVIKRAWMEKPPSIYGRFDFAYDGMNRPKLLEFNADTPTSLVEAAVIQWYWKEEVLPEYDQFNSIHEKLIEQWKAVMPRLQGDVVYFCHAESDEDMINVTYLRDTAHQAGIEATSALLMPEIGWDAVRKCFTDLEENPILDMFKLYPWEWMLDDFGEAVLDTYFDMNWIEPIWKMLWANKGLLAILWELYPNHPNLLEAHIGAPGGLTRYARKPLLGREGANVTLVTDTGNYETEGAYTDGGCVYQALAPIPRFDGCYPVIGSWHIPDLGPAGIGIRESKTPITDNLSRFVPHVFR